MIFMDFDPHTLHQIIRRIEQQMRCPQCGEKVPVDFASVRLTGDDFVLLQIKCETCEAYIVLHASLQGIKQIEPDSAEADKILNASSTLQLKDSEVEALRAALSNADGKIDSLFDSKE